MKIEFQDSMTTAVRLKPDNIVIFCPLTIRGVKGLISCPFDIQTEGMGDFIPLDSLDQDGYNVPSCTKDTILIRLGKDFVIVPQSIVKEYIGVSEKGYHVGALLAKALKESGLKTAIVSVEHGTRYISSLSKLTDETVFIPSEILFQSIFASVRKHLGVNLEEREPYELDIRQDGAAATFKLPRRDRNGIRTLLKISNLFGEAISASLSWELPQSGARIILADERSRARVRRWNTWPLLAGKLDQEISGLHDNVDLFPRLYAKAMREPVAAGKIAETAKAMLTSCDYRVPTYLRLEIAKSLSNVKNASTAAEVYAMICDIAWRMRDGMAPNTFEMVFRRVLGAIPLQWET